ncbi:hypothetical protein [Streptomyces milbemycinicus]|uniref:Uncharacterized protein n=1 Tax=Streptomyces milbemycinicus TaxID=476552 RepID=A0ABW8M328_9ACTN
MASIPALEGHAGDREPNEAEVEKLLIRARAEFLAGETNLVISAVNAMGRAQAEQLYGRTWSAVPSGSRTAAA